MQQPLIDQIANPPIQIKMRWLRSGWISNILKLQDQKGREKIIALSVQLLLRRTKAPFKCRSSAAVLSNRLGLLDSLRRLASDVDIVREAGSKMPGCAKPSPANRSAREYTIKSNRHFTVNQLDHVNY